MAHKISHSVVSNSLRPHGLQHARPPCPSPTLRACSNSCPSSQWCHPSHPLSSPSPAFNLSQHQGLFQWVSSLHQVAKVLGWEILWSTPCKQETRDSCWCDLFSVPKPENLESWWCNSQFKHRRWDVPSSSSESGQKGEFLLPLPFVPFRPSMNPWAHLHQGGWPTLLSPYRVQRFKC